MVEKGKTNVEETECGYCNGRGQIQFTPLDSTLPVQYMRCPTCCGSGKKTIIKTYYTCCPGKEYTFNRGIKRPFTCPTCGGHKTVQKPPWIAGDQEHWDSTSNEFYPCPTCNATGIIWGPPE